MDTRTARRPARTVGLKEALGRALPRRELAVSREVLINAIVQRIETWKSFEVQIAPHADRVAASTAISKSLATALEKAARALERLGVAEDIERAKAKARTLGIDSDHPPLAGHSAALDLYLTVWQAAHRVRVWNRIYRRQRGNPGALSAGLTEMLEELCRQHAGLSQYEFDEFLAMISGTAGLPRLSSETLRKRRQRKRVQRGTK